MSSRLAIGFLLLSLSLRAQDAGLVLRTLVSYGTAKASTPLTPEQKAEADRLGLEARKASDAGRYGEALRQYYHGFAVMQGTTWTPTLEWSAALQAKADHAMTEAGKTVAIKIAPYYSVETAPALDAAVVLHAVKNDQFSDRVLVAKQTIIAGRTPVMLSAKIPGDVPAGNYQLLVKLTGPEQPADHLPSGAIKTLPIHVEPLAKQADELRARLQTVQNRDAKSLPTARYTLVLYEKADKGETNPQLYDFEKEFAATRVLLDAIESGKDSFANQQGDVRRAYNSAVDNSLQPYRLFIPERADTAAKLPLVVALHGMGGDENAMFDAYAAGAIKREAAKHGFMVVCPKGRDSASMYRGTAEQDVLDVLSDVRRMYPIDADRIYLMGHSMGGYGTWSIAMDHPELFAALGPIAGGGNPAGMAKLKAIPQYVVHGDADKTVPVTQSRTMVEAGKKAGAKIEYVEVPGGSHGNVVVPQFGPMFDFFAQQKRAHPAE